MRLALFVGVLLSLAAAAPNGVRAAGADAARGADIFQDRCSMCHLEEGQGQGPNLKGVVGRKAATLPGFAYTSALMGSGLTWTPETLDRWLQGPAKLVPGTSMPATAPKPEERADLIAYLATLK